MRWSNSPIVFLVVLITLTSTSTVAAQGLTPTPANSMAGASAGRVDLADLWTWREIAANSDFVGHPIGTVTVLNRRAAADPNVPEDRPADQTLAREFEDREKRDFRLVTSGTFFDSKTGQPSGSVLRLGGSFHAGVAKTGKRGAMAVLADGTIVLGRAAGTGARDIDERFGTAANPVAQFLGGGALLIENGRTIDSNTLETVGRFDQVGGKPCKPGEGGIKADQFRSTRHLVIAVRKGQAFVLVNDRDMNGVELQAALKRGGFETAVKFDGGGGLFYDDGGVALPRQDAGAANPTGLGILPSLLHVVCEQAKLTLTKEKPDDQSDEDFLASLLPSDFKFEMNTDQDGKPRLLHFEVEATALLPAYRAILYPGEKIVVPLHLEGEQPNDDGTITRFKGTLPLPMKIVATYWRMEDALAAHESAGLNDPKAGGNIEVFRGLLRLDEKDGRAKFEPPPPPPDEDQDQGKGKFETGPLDQGWTDAHKAQYLDMYRQLPQLRACFVATAVFGDRDHRALDRLRRFRDQGLMASEDGRALVRLYYERGSGWARDVAGRPLLRLALRPLIAGFAAATAETDWRSRTTSLVVERTARALRMLGSALLKERRAAPESRAMSDRLRDLIGFEVPLGN